jgi:regulatory protein
MEITKISAQLKNPERVSIFVDGSYSFSLSLNQLLQEKIVKGQQLNPEALAQLIKLSNIGKLKAKAIEWLYIRPRSEQELKFYLKKQDIDEQEAGNLVSQLQKKGYQDDLTFATWWRDQRLAKNRSQTYISHELRLKGVPSYIINEVLASTANQDAGSLSNLIAKKNLLQKYPDQKKLVAYLQRQGFSYHVIKQQLNELNR